MDRARFEALLAAYGADVSRWPEAERAEAAAFVAQHQVTMGDAIKEAREIDMMLAHAVAAPKLDALASRILASAPKRAVFDRRALIALAACAVFGVVLGYGGGLLAPAPFEDDSYFALAFEAPGDEG